MSVFFILPIPPSVNHAYEHTRRGVRLTDEAKRYKAQAGLIVRNAFQTAMNPEPPLRLTMIVSFPSWQGDLDNTLKLSQDAIAAALNVNDSYITELHLYKRIDQDNPRCEVWLDQAEERLKLPKRRKKAA